MSRTFKVRFAPAKVASSAPGFGQVFPDNSTTALQRPQSQPESVHAGRSRAGCRECKRRRVKCDEKYPICGACERRSAICESMPRLRQWQVELPWLLQQGNKQPNGRGEDNNSLVPPPCSLNTSIALIDHGPQHADKGLVQYWFERASQIMVIDPDINPLSFPMMNYIKSSPSLFHIIQSISAAHQNFFSPTKLTKCLEERTWALQKIRQELSACQENIFPVFVTIFLLGLSTAWTDHSYTDLGHQHLFGARALVDRVLASTKQTGQKAPFQDFIVGSYIYWDMAYSFLIPSAEQNCLNTEAMSNAVYETSLAYHPIGGYSIEIFYLVANIGRYCRLVVDTGIRDPIVEATFEQELITWEPNRENHELGLMSDAFRYHGLINLATICHRRSVSDKQSRRDLNSKIQGYARKVMRLLGDVPVSNPFINLHAMPLFTVSAELRADDTEEREQARKRFMALYSMNHLRANLYAVTLLEELWDRMDDGHEISWLELMLEKNQLVMLG